MDSARILIVEDDAIIATHLKVALTSMGYQVTGLAATGETAISAALLHMPDAILMDIRLRGEMTGIQAAEEIHKTADIPIIYLTAYTDEDHLQKAKISDASAYLSKPLRNYELRASLEMALYKHGVEQRIEHLNQVLRAISEVNQLLTREHNPLELLESVCKILVRTRGYRFVWIGQLDGKRAKAVATAGKGKAFLDLIAATANQEQAQNLPCATSIRTKKPVICPNVFEDERYRPWQKEAKNAGFYSSAAIPMLYGKRQFGTLCVFSDRSEGFNDKEELTLLLEVAGEIALRLKTIEEEVERKRAEEKLRESEQRFHALIEKAADLIMVISSEGLIQFASPTVEKITGHQPQEVVGRNFLDWVHPDDLPIVKRTLASRIQIPSTASGSLTVRTRHKSGEWRILEALGTNLLEEPAIQGIVLNIRDVTEREQAERTIELKDELLRMTGIMAKVGGWEFDSVTLKGIWTDEVARIHDLDPRDKTSVELGVSFYTGESREKIEKAIEEALVFARPYDLELEMTSAKGAHKWVRTMGLPILNANQVVKVRGIFQDITEQKLAEKVIRESESRYRSLFEYTPVSLLEEDFSGAKQILDTLKRQGIIDFETYLALHPEVVAECAAQIKVTDVNKAGLRLFQAEKKEDLLTDLTRLLVKESVNYFILELANIAKGKKFFEWEGINRTLAGELIYISLNWLAAPGYEESLSKVIVSIIDLTERKRVVEALQESEERYHQLFDLSPDAIVIHNGKTFQLANPAAAEILGASSLQDLIGRSILDVIHPDYVEKVKEQAKLLLEGKPVPTVTEKFIRLDGLVIDVNVTALPYSDNTTRSALTILHDITEQKKAEDILRRQNAYLAALQETMLELISLHDLNTLLENIVRRAGQLLGTEAGYLDLVEPETNQLKPQIGLGALTESLKYTAQPGEGVAGTVWQTAKPLVIDNYDVWEGRVTKFSPNTIQSIIGIPLCSGEQVVGVLGLAYVPPSKRTFGKEEIGLITQFARLATLAIENARVFAALQQELVERKQAEVALRKSEASIRSIYRSMDEMLVLHELVYDLFGKAIDYRIIDCNAAFTAITGIPQEQAIGALGSQLYGTGEAPYLDIYARVADTGETIHFETNFVPMKKFFSISAFSPEKDHFATISSDITQRKAAEAEINRHLSELEVLYENGLAISQLLEPKQIGQKLIETLSKKLAWHHASIRVIQPETGKLELLAYGHSGFSSAEIEAEISRLNQLVTDLGKGLSGRVTKHGKPVRCAQVKKNKYYLETYPGIQSGLYVPIQVGGHTIGSIAVESEQEDAFSEQDQRLLTTIASQAAISIQNAQLFLTAQQELAARKQAEQALLEAHAELEQRVAERTAEVQDLYNNAPCGYHSLDANGKFVHINKTELDWLGCKSENIIGHPAKEFLAESSQAMFTELFPVFKKDGVLKDQELEFLRKDGSILPLLVNATAIYDENGTYKMSRSTSLDITPRKLVEQALRESESRLRQNRDELSAANIALEKAARMKDEFLASMSHELRTPLTGILGLSEALQLSTYGDLSDKQLKALKNIENSGRHLLELINDILDLSKIEAGKFEVHMEQFSLTDIGRASLQLAKGMAQQKHQKVSFSMNPNSIYLRADPRRLKQMLVNLLSNAVKFTPDGGSIGLDVQGNESEQLVRLTVWDTGIGIKAEDLKNLFRPFVQLDSSLSRQYSGTGLGLSLVQRMAELQGGKVEVESVPTKGSRFTIILPWAIQDDESTDTSPRKTSSSTAIQFAPAKETGRKELPALILVADDNEDVLGILSDFLEVEHFRVITTRSGRELLERAPELHPDIFLIDIQMPGIDGLETIRRIRAHPDSQIAKVPIIAITALAMPGDRESCLAAGANEYLSKPLQLVKLIEVIREILH